MHVCQLGIYSIVDVSVNKNGCPVYVIENANVIQWQCNAITDAVRLDANSVIILIFVVESHFLHYTYLHTYMDIIIIIKQCNYCNYISVLVIKAYYNIIILFHCGSWYALNDYIIILFNLAINLVINQPWLPCMLYVPIRIPTIWRVAIDGLNLQQILLL